MPETDPNEVYMRYLPRSCTEADLREKFEKCGRIKKVWLSLDKETSECKGFGFVTFSSKTEAKRCVKDFNEHPRNWMDGKHVVITHAKGWDDGRKPVQICSFGLGCSREDCYFNHPKGWDPLNPKLPGDAGGDGSGGEGDDAGDGGGEEGAGGGGAGAKRSGGGGGKKSSGGAKRPRDDGGGGGGGGGGDGDGDGGAGGNKGEHVYPWRKKIHKHKTGAKARKRAKAREAKEAAGGGGD
jgi:hypothetical protein